MAILSSAATAQYCQQLISEAENRLGELLESAPDAILEHGSEGRIVLRSGQATGTCFAFTIPCDQFQEFNGVKCCDKFGSTTDYR
jgi:hypothetical protein